LPGGRNNEIETKEHDGAVFLANAAAKQKRNKSRRTQ